MLAILLALTVALADGQGALIPRPMPVCPAGFGLAFGNNTLGTCDCYGQLFIGEDCHKGFFCREPGSITISGVYYDGCEIECAEDEVLVVDPHNGGSWDCVRTNDGSRPSVCPGKFNTECGCSPEVDESECPIGDCECDGQFRMNHDCSEARLCNSTEPNNGYTSITCTDDPANPIVMVNMATHTWFCGNDTEMCQGAFHVGCQEDPPTPAPPPPSPIWCQYGNNTLGDCRCNGELFIAHECHSGFFCLSGGDDPLIDTDTGMWQGCEIECEPDEILVVDPHNGGQWECHKTNEGTRPLLCPGKFNTECACRPEEPENPDDEPVECRIGDCACDTQVWVAHDCHEAKICSGTGEDEFEMLECGKNNATHPYVSVNLIRHSWFCSNDPACPGSFHVGCQSDEYETTTTIMTTTTTTNPGPDSGSLGNAASYLLCIVTLLTPFVV